MSGPGAEMDFDLVAANGKTGTATLAVTTQTPAKARRTAWRAVGCLGIVALAALPIPIVHFIVPPAALLLSPLVWTVIYRLFRSGIDAGGTAACPSCGKGTPLSLSLPEPAHAESVLGPATTNCSVCLAPLTLTSRRPPPPRSAGE